MYICSDKRRSKFCTRHGSLYAMLSNLELLQCLNLKGILRFNKPIPNSILLVQTDEVPWVQQMNEKTMEEKREFHTAERQRRG